ncbi:MAG: hypothetical protein JXC32_08925, partial [Anaerolineae bacterium]|nr:hypothetical protein [Anaerolineae bacterium]
KKSSTWWAVGLGLLGLVPVLAWNARHGWASFAWQLSHLTLSSPGSSAGALFVGLGRNLAHAAVYFSWPLALAVCAGLFRTRTPADRWLSLVALLVLAPVAVSPANSPRNLTTGAVPLLLLAADRGMRAFAGATSSGRRSLALLGVAACWIAVAIYGSGSVVAMVREAPQVPQSSVVREIRYDAAGWDTLAGQLPGDGTLVAVDYSLAGHLAYYTDRPVTTAWPQYRMWGTPDLEDVLVVASTYLAPGVVASQVEAAYTEYAALAPVVMGKVGGETKQLRLWSADGLRVPPEEFLDRMDFLTLYAEGQ